MASIGQIIFWSMIVLIVVCAGFIILLLAIAFSASQGTVETKEPFPVGNLGEDVVLQCDFFTKTGSKTSGDVTITWEKKGLTGLVSQYKNKAEQSQGQNPQFQNRVKFFTDAIAGGNASLLLTPVRKEDAGVYLCSVSAPGVSGRVSIDLRLGVYTAPQISKWNNSLRAVALRWEPKPDATWFDQNEKQLNSSTQFNPTSDQVVEVVSYLQDTVIGSQKYTCIIQNSLIKSISVATGDGVLSQSSFQTNSSPKTMLLHIAGTTPFLLYLLAW